MVEHHLAMVGVAGSNPVFRFANSLLCRGGGIGRRTGLKILRSVMTVPVRSRSSALFAPIAQLDRVSDYESEGCRFDSYWVHFREVAQLGRAPGLGPGGRRFESCLPDLNNLFLIIYYLLFMFFSRCSSAG